MDTITFEKAEYTWYGISILPNDKSVDIILLFRKLDKGHEFFKLITESNPHPSFYCFQQPDKTHKLKIDYSSVGQNNEYLVVPCEYTIETYPPLELLKQNKSFKIIIGTEQILEGQVINLRTTMTFVPKVVRYSEQPEQFEFHQEQKN